MMKSLFYSLCVVAATFLTTTTPAFAEAETKKVCINVKKDGKDVVDPKTNKPKQTCKEVKQHKKLEGTKVPEKK
jgi:hypothetical protein